MYVCMYVCMYIFEMARRTVCRLECMFRAILSIYGPVLGYIWAFEMAHRTVCRLECMFRAILSIYIYKYTNSIMKYEHFQNPAGAI